MTDELTLRLRAARPRAARPDEQAFDAELLARIHRLPIARRSVPRAVTAPVLAGVTLTAAGALMFGGGPGTGVGPSSAAAITQALRWLNPPPGTILHVRSVETMGARTTTRELWQSADDPTAQRESESGAFEMAGDGLYDPTTNTIYPDAPVPGDKRAPGTPGPAMPPGDAMVAKVRILLREGHLEVTGREVHNGIAAWAIALKPGFGPVWKIWVSAADGKPLELRDPGRHSNDPPQLIRWPVYEVLPDTGADRLLTLRGAHPSARVVHGLPQMDDQVARASGRRKRYGSRTSDRPLVPARHP